MSRRIPQPRAVDRRILNAPISGGRDAYGRQIPYVPDPVRDPGAEWNRGGYLTPGYDSGRVF